MYSNVHYVLWRIGFIDLLSEISAFFFQFATISVQNFALVLSQSHLSPQDDSDDEPPTSKRGHSRGDTMDFIDLSCEEGEETASSEVHTEVSYFPLCCDFGENLKSTPAAFFSLFL